MCLRVAESVHLLFVIRLRVLVPKNVEGIEDGLGTAKHQVAELWFAMRIEADNLAVENTPAALQVTSQSFAQAGETFELFPLREMRRTPSLSE